MMKVRIMILCIISLFACFLTAYVFSADEYTDPSKTLEAIPGSDVKMVLESNRTTGFEWQLITQSDKDVVEFVGSEYIAGDSQVVGSAGREIWTFKAIGAGKTSVTLGYVRPWEKDMPPAKTRTFTVIVNQKIIESAIPK